MGLEDVKKYVCMYALNMSDLFRLADWRLAEARTAFSSPTGEAIQALIPLLLSPHRLFFAVLGGAGQPAADAAPGPAHAAPAAVAGGRR